MKLSTAVEEFLQECRVGLAQQTHQAYKSDLQLLISLAHFHAKDSVLEFTPALVRRYFHELSSKGLSMATLHRRRASVNQFGKWGVRRRLWAQNPVEQQMAIRKPRRLPRPFTAQESAALRALPLVGVERVIFDLLRYAGLRVSEVCGLRMGSISLGEPGRVGYLRVTGKGNKQRQVPLVPELSETLKDWMLAAGDLFTPAAPLIRQRSGIAWTRKMVEKRTARWGQAAGVVKCTPHRFRHECASELLRHGADISVIQRILGHEDVSTTALYVQVQDQAVIAAMLSLSSQEPADQEKRVPQ